MNKLAYQDPKFGKKQGVKIVAEREIQRVSVQHKPRNPRNLRRGRLPKAESERFQDMFVRLGRGAGRAFYSRETVRA